MFYQSIAPYYDFIFPKNNKQLSFIEGILPIRENEHILDIGAATGNLTGLLASRSNHVTGLDLDLDLLTVARRKHPTLPFVHGDMLNINTLFDKPFDRIISFGNTLVHLPTRMDVQGFFKAVHQQLSTEGLFIVQIINYDHIVDKGITGLPTIENDSIQFVREYVLHDHYLDFNTMLTIKSENRVLTNSVPLLTLTKDEIKNYLKAAGFIDLQFYGSLAGTPVTDVDIPLLFSAKKASS